MAELSAFAGDPNGTVKAAKGSLIADTTNARLYQNTTGLMVWSQVGAGSGVTIGDAITGGTTGSLLFVKAGPIIGQDNASAFYDFTNKRFGIGTASPLRTLSAHGNVSGDTIFEIQNDNAAGYSSGNLHDNAAAFQAAWGWGNGSVALAYLRNNPYLFVNNSNSPGNKAWLVANETAVALRLHDQSAGAGISFANGGTNLGVSAANEATLRYNTGTSRLELSNNGGAYAKVGTSDGVTIGDAITSGTTGSILFVGAGPVFAQRNSKIFWDDTNSRLLVGFNTVGGGMSEIQDSTSGTEVLRLRNNNTAGGSGMQMQDNSGAFKFSIGYANASNATAYIQQKNYLYSGGPDLVMTNSTKNEFVFGMTDGSTMIEFANGSSAGVSSSGTGRLRYNSGTNKFEVSLNGAAYVSVVTL